MNFVKNIPNLLTFSRILLVPVISFLMYLKSYDFIVLFIIIYCSITDYLDGYLARYFKNTSKIGEFLDPVADKLLVVGVLLMMTYRGVFLGFDILFVNLIIFREIFISELRGAIIFSVSKFAKLKTAVQMFTIILFCLNLSLQSKNLFIPFLDLDFLVTLSRGFLYFSFINSLITCVNYTIYLFDYNRH